MCKRYTGALVLLSDYLIIPGNELNSRVDILFRVYRKEKQTWLQGFNVDAENQLKMKLVPFFVEEIQRNGVELPLLVMGLMTQLHLLDPIVE